MMSCGSDFATVEIGSLIDGEDKRLNDISGSYMTPWPEFSGLSQPTTTAGENGECGSQPRGEVGESRPEFVNSLVQPQRVTRERGGAVSEERVEFVQGSKTIISIFPILN